MNVLLTNDDGIHAEGLQALRRALLDTPGVELSEVLLATIERVRSTAH